jgi:hypothetical protein
LITYSEQFDNAAWSKSNVTITANNTTSPDGTQNADLSTATAGGELLQGVVLSTSTSYTFSFYVKKGTASDAKYRVYNFDAGVNVVAPTSYISQTSTSDWVRVVVSFTTGATGTNYGIYLLDQTSAGTMYFYGAQLEASSYATSYIPTTSSSATRVADLASVPQGTIANFGTGAFSVFLDVNFAKLSTTGAIALLGNRQNVSWWRIYGDGTYFYLELNGSNGFQTNVIFTANEITSRTKIAFTRNGNNVKVYKNGASVLDVTNVVYSSDFTTGNSQIDFNFWGGSSTYEITTTQYNQAVLFKQALTATELAQLTTL